MEPIIGQRGLKIRLVKDYCESWAMYNGFVPLGAVMAKVEKFVTLKNWLILIFGIVAFLTRMDRLTMAVAACLICVFCTLGSLYRPFYQVCRLFDYTQPLIISGLMGWFLDKIALIVLGIFTVGWVGLLYFAIGYISGLIVGFVYMTIAGSTNRQRYGINLQDSELSFILILLSMTKSKITPAQWVADYAAHLNMRTSEEAASL